MRIDIFTIFPEVINGFCSKGLLHRALSNGLLDLVVHDLRGFTNDPRRSVDDAPFGGGAGMILTPAPIFEAIETSKPPRPLYLLSPRGKLLDQALVTELANKGEDVGEGFSLLCGRYEGVDQRVVDHLVDEELSIGDYILAGGEVAALVVIEAVTRLLRGVVGNEESCTDESFASGLLEYPQYTRPANFRGMIVSEVLTSGNHQRIAQWRRAQAIKITLERRPDLIDRRGGLSEEEIDLLTMLEKGELS